MVYVYVYVCVCVCVCVALRFMVHRFFVFHADVPRLFVGASFSHRPLCPPHFYLPFSLAQLPPLVELFFLSLSAV
jgi:hypothetical protein